MESAKLWTARRPKQHRLHRTQIRRIQQSFTILVFIATILLINILRLVDASLSNGICDLDCPTSIGAKCTFGETSNMILMNSTTAKSINGMHCTCPEFYTGIQCEFSYDSCNDKNQHVCYHGGTCQAGGVDEYGNTEHYCDCSSAKDAVTKNPYVGKYCELATVATCDSDIEPNSFCFNGGICNDKFP